MLHLYEEERQLISYAPVTTCLGTNVYTWTSEGLNFHINYYYHLSSVYGIVYVGGEGWNTIPLKNPLENPELPLRVCARIPISTLKPNTPCNV
jgi:hypothetical protein